MNSRLASLLAVLLAVPACATVPLDDEDTDTSSAALKRGGMDLDAPVKDVRPPKPLPPQPPPPQPPPPPKYPDVIGPIGPVVGVFEAECARPRYDGRRTTRACTDLPGVTSDGTSHYLAGAGGKWKIDYVFPESVPANVRSRACSYTWTSEGSTCHSPDKSVLLLDTEEEQALQLRSAACAANASSCEVAYLDIEAIRLAPGSPIFWPGGGRCDVCGFVYGDRMYAVLPDYWSGFSYKLSLGSAAFAGAGPETDFVVDVGDVNTGTMVIQLDASYPEQTISLAPVLPGG